jgi:hypothetical protein
LRLWPAEHIDLLVKIKSPRIAHLKAISEVDAVNTKQGARQDEAGAKTKTPPIFIGGALRDCFKYLLEQSGLAQFATEQAEAGERHAEQGKRRAAVWNPWGR